MEEAPENSKESSHSAYGSEMNERSQLLPHCVVYFLNSFLLLLFLKNAFCLQVSALLGRIPSAVGYQPTLATDMGTMQERITTTKKGSITSVQVLNSAVFVFVVAIFYIIINTESSSCWACCRSILLKTRVTVLATRFNIQKLYMVLTLHCVFCPDLSTNSNFRFVQNEQIGFV
jgi:hypothetical protein